MSPGNRVSGYSHGLTAISPFRTVSNSPVICERRTDHISGCRLDLCEPRLCRLAGAEPLIFFETNSRLDQSSIDSTHEPSQNIIFKSVVFAHVGIKSRMVPLSFTRFK